MRIAGVNKQPVLTGEGVRLEKTGGGTPKASHRRQKTIKGGQGLEKGGRPRQYRRLHKQNRPSPNRCPGQHWRPHPHNCPGLHGRPYLHRRSGPHSPSNPQRCLKAHFFQNHCLPLLKNSKPVAVARRAVEVFPVGAPDYRSRAIETLERI